MSTNRKSSATPQAGTGGQRGGRRGGARKDLQPQASGANRGSPAAGVMKQFAKTKAESGGRS